MAETMRAVALTEHGDASVLKEMDLPLPRPGPGEVAVAVKAVALNHLDIWVRRGGVGNPNPKPFVLGSDISGVVREAGPGVAAVKPGDEVVVAPGVCCGACKFCLRGEDSLCERYGILGETQPGGYAEVIVVPQANVLAKPKNLDFARAAAFPLTYLTAWRMLVVRGGIKPQDTVLVTGASSGVSVAGIQIAKLHGCTVVAATSSADKARRARDVGADHVVDSTGDLKKQLRAAVGGGADAVLEHVGGDTFKAALGLLNRGGRLVTCGATAGPVVQLDLRHVFIKQQTIMGSTMGSRADLLEVCNLVGEGRLSPVVDQVLPLSRAREAHGLLENRTHFGKVVLAP